MNVLMAIVLVLIAIASWFGQLLGLPGNWLIVLAAALYAWWVPPEAATAVSWTSVAVLAGLAVVGELLELVAASAGVTKVGGSRRGAVLAIVGSIVGSIVGIFIGVPIPFVGSLVAAIVFGGLGALIGAMLGESWKGRDFDTSLTVGKAAFIGRMLGTVSKLVVSSIMVAVTIAAIIF